MPIPLAIRLWLFGKSTLVTSNLWLNLAMCQLKFELLPQSSLMFSCCAYISCHFVVKAGYIVGVKWVENLLCEFGYAKPNQLAENTYSSSLRLVSVFIGLSASHLDVVPGFSSKVSKS